MLRSAILARLEQMWLDAGRDKHLGNFWAVDEIFGDDGFHGAQYGAMERGVEHITRNATCEWHPGRSRGLQCRV